MGRYGRKENTSGGPKLPGQRRRDEQTLLDPMWDDKYITSYKHGAQIIGDYYEEAAHTLFEIASARRLRTANLCICPDLRESERGEFYIECKAAGPAGRVYLIYDANHKAYCDLIDNFFPTGVVENPDMEPVLLFTLWSHGIKGIKEQFDYKSELREGLSFNTRRLVLVDLDVIKGIKPHKRMEGAVRPPETRNDSTYPPFFRIRVTDFNELEKGKRPFVERWELDLPDHWYTSAVVPALSVYDTVIENCPVYVLVHKRTKKKKSLKHFFAYLKWCREHAENSA